MKNDSYPQAVICVANDGNEVSLQLWKIYKPLRDDDARSEGLLRVIDESGEDDLFPEDNFVPIELPGNVRKTFERAALEQRRGSNDAARDAIGKASAGFEASRFVVKAGGGDAARSAGEDAGAPLQCAAASSFTRWKSSSTKSASRRRGWSNTSLSISPCAFSGNVTNPFVTTGSRQCVRNVS